MNKVILVGRIANIDLKHLQDDKSMCLFNIATNESYKDSIGQMVRHTDWHNCVCWNHIAQHTSTIQIGSLVLVEGKIKYSTFVDKSGNTKNATQIFCELVKVLTKPYNKEE